MKILLSLGAVFFTSNFPAFHEFRIASIFTKKSVRPHGLDFQPEARNFGIL